MKARLILLLGLIVRLLCVNTTAEDKGSIWVTGVGTATVPMDTVTITVSTRSTNDNATQAIAQNANLLNKTDDALLAAGVNHDEILPGYSNSLMNYRSMVCSTSNNITICKYTVTNIAFGQMTLRVKRDESRIDRTLEAVRSAGAAAAISGYSLSDIKAIVDEIRKKAFYDVRQNAQDHTSTFGFSLGKVTALMEPRSPDVEIVPQVEAGLPIWHLWIIWNAQPLLDGAILGVILE